jgi:CheY-like chemotaxis protein
MQVLLAHGDAEIGAQLVQMVTEYSVHQCDFVRTGDAALAWAAQHKRCDFLLTQLSSEGIDGFTLAANLTEHYPKLQTAFFPSYASSQQCLEIRDTKIFPEPIDGGRLVEMLEQADALLSRAVDLFHPADLLQMCCLAGKSGALQLVSGGHAGLVFLRKGNLVHAEREGLRGPTALKEIVAWDQVEFAYDPSLRPASESIKGSSDAALIDAVAARKKSPSIRAR